MEDNSKYLTYFTCFVINIYIYTYKTWIYNEEENCKIYLSKKNRWNPWIYLSTKLLTIVVFDWIVSVHFQNSPVIEIRSRAPNSIIVFQLERSPNPRYVKQINDSSTLLLVAADSLISTTIAVDAQVTIAMPIVGHLSQSYKIVGFFVAHLRCLLRRFWNVDCVIDHRLRTNRMVFHLLKLQPVGELSCTSKLFVNSYIAD